LVAPLEKLFGISIKVDHSYTLQPSNFNARYNFLPCAPEGICKCVHDSIAVIEKNPEAIQIYPLTSKWIKCGIFTQWALYTRNTNEMSLYILIPVNLSKIMLNK
jgi:hypothetical protein